MTPARIIVLGLGTVLVLFILWSIGSETGVEETRAAAAPVPGHVDVPDRVARTQVERAVIPTGPPSLTGRVTDDRGGVHAAIEIEIELEGGEQSLSTVSDAEGRFAFSELPPGEYDLACWTPGSLYYRRHLTLAPGEHLVLDVILELLESIPIGIRLRGTPEARDRVSPSWFLRTRVTESAFEPGEDPTEMRGLRDVSVDLDWTEGSGYEGRISFDSERPERAYVHLMLGTHVIESRLMDRATRSIVFIVEREALRGVFASVALRWVDPSEPPFTVRTSFESRGTRHNRHALDSRGRMLADSLPPGDHVVRITSGEITFYDKRVTLAAGEHLDLGVAHPLLIEGRVVGPNGGPVRNVPVRLGRFLPEHDVVSWTENRWMRTDREGSFRFDRLVPGRYVLRCDRVADPTLLTEFSDAATGGVWVEMKDRAMRALTLELQPAYPVTVPGRGDKARTRSLRIHDASGHELRSEWVLDEPYTLHLVPGNYRVAWWSEREELAREAFVVSNGPVTLRPPP